jgi:hypothetical protein
MAHFPTSTPRTFDVSKSHHEHLETMRREQTLLMEQIRQTKETIAESQELLRLLDEVLPIAEQKP